MRYPKLVGAALLLSAGLLIGSGPAAATTPGLLYRHAVAADSPVEKAGYYYRRRHYGYRYRRPYYGYGYGYRRPYYGYGYGRRWRY